VALTTEKYKIKFYHKTLSCEQLTEWGISLPFGEQRRCTIARIYSQDNPDLIAGEYIAICNPTDNFNRSVGRKNSLCGVLSVLENKDERKEIWEAYRKQFKG